MHLVVGHRHQGLLSDKTPALHRRSDTPQLDTHSAATVIDTLGHLADAGRIVIIATHDPRVAATCTRTITLGQEP